MNKTKFSLLFVLIFALAIAGCQKREEVKPDPQPQPQPAPAVEAVVTTTVVEVEKVAQPIPDYTFKPVKFAFRKATLTKRAQDALRSNAQFLVENPSLNIVVSGFCDDRGSVAFNMKLGLNRANAVKKYYVSRGIKADRIKTVSYGKDKKYFISKGKRPKDRAVNRRAETRLALNQS
ncbi:MAG: OmpA family protein [Elusimicrobiota bacterium]|jgi:peptidoglycan-associated lipoprotein|nr:OmpA family protein [Elusimicrobiota bacterium]